MFPFPVFLLRRYQQDQVFSYATAAAAAPVSSLVDRYSGPVLLGVSSYWIEMLMAPGSSGMAGEL